MLADPPPRTSLVNHFAAEWLNLRRRRRSLVDPLRYFPITLEPMRHSVETELFVESTIREDGLSRTSDADYTFSTERRLATTVFPGFTEPVPEGHVPNHESAGRPAH